LSNIDYAGMGIDLFLPSNGGKQARSLFMPSSHTNMLGASFVLSVERIMHDCCTPQPVNADGTSQPDKCEGDGKTTGGEYGYPRNLEYGDSVITHPSVAVYSVNTKRGSALGEIKTEHALLGTLRYELSELKNVCKLHVDGEVGLLYETPSDSSVTGDSKNAYVVLKTDQGITDLWTVPRDPSPTKTTTKTTLDGPPWSFDVQYVFKQSDDSVALLIIGGPNKIELHKRYTLGVYKVDLNKFNSSAQKDWSFQFDLPFELSDQIKGRGHSYNMQGDKLDGPFGVRAAYDSDKKHLYIGTGPITVLDLTSEDWKIAKTMDPKVTNDEYHVADIAFLRV